MWCIGYIAACVGCVYIWNESSKGIPSTDYQCWYCLLILVPHEIGEKNVQQ